MNSNPHLPPLSAREIYALSHPNSPDFESEMMQKSWMDPNYKKPTVTPVLKHALPFDAGFFGMHEKFNDQALDFQDYKNYQDFMEDHK